MLAISATDGWLYGDDENEIGWALYVARDGGRSWNNLLRILQGSNNAKFA